MLNNIDLSKIRVFKEVFLNLNIHRASESLHISPSAVSQSLKNLESELGKQLFIRSKQRILPTELAKDFFERIVPLYQNLTGELADFVLDRSGLVRTIRVGAPIHFGSEYLVNFIKRWEKKNDYLVDMYLADSATLLTKLKRGELDMFFAEKELSAKGITRGIRRRCVIDDTLTFACGPKIYELLESKSIRYNKMVSLPHLLKEDQSELMECYLHYFKKKPLSLSSKLITNDSESLLKAVLANLGVGVFYYSQIENYLIKGTLIDMMLDRKPLQKSLDLFQLDNFIPSDGHLSFVEQLLETLK